MRLFFSLIVLLVLSNNSFSQDVSSSNNNSTANNASASNNKVDYERSFSLGAVTGLNISNVVGADVSNNSSRSGLHLGIYSEFDLKNKFGLRPEFHLISTKGTANGNFRTSYIDIPLLGTYQAGEKIKVLAGVQPSILLNATVADGRGNISGLIRSLDFGFIVGGWYQISDDWGVDARFAPGLSRVGASGQERTYNSNFQLSVGYRFL